MTEQNQPKKADDIVTRMIALADEKFNCSQILLILALEQEGKEIPDLVRAMAGLGDGCGFFEETCGTLTGAVCLMAWYGGKGTADEKESPHLLPMLQELGDWFQAEVGQKYNGTRCKEIVGDRVGTPEGKQICGGIIYRTYQRTNEILADYGFL